MPLARRGRGVLWKGVQQITTILSFLCTRSKESPPPLSSLLSTFTFSSNTQILPNAQQGWCGFHKVDRNFTSNVEYRGILGAERDKDIFGRVEIDITVRWMWYFIKYITVLEAATRSKIVEFLCKSFFVHSDMLFESCFEGTTMEEVTTASTKHGIEQQKELQEAHAQTMIWVKQQR